MATKKSLDDVIAREAENYYRELPFPFAYLPKPGHPVDNMALISTVKPLLEGVYALLLAQAETFETGSLDVGAQHGSILLASQVKLCVTILDRWWEQVE